MEVWIWSEPKTQNELYLGPKSSNCAEILHQSHNIGVLVRKVSMNTWKLLVSAPCHLLFFKFDTFISLFFSKNDLKLAKGIIKTANVIKIIIMVMDTKGVISSVP